MRTLIILFTIASFLLIGCKQYRPGTTENLIYRHLKGDLDVAIKEDSANYRMCVLDKEGKDLSDKFLVSAGYIFANNGNRGVGVIGMFTKRQLNYAGYDTSAASICVNFNYYTLSSMKQLRKPVKQGKFKVWHDGLKVYEQPHIKVPRKTLCIEESDKH